LDLRHGKCRRGPDERSLRDLLETVLG